MKTITLIDLDDSIFQTLRKCPKGAALTAAAANEKGEAHSFCTERQREFLRFITEGGVVVPVTGRETSSFRRVEMTFSAHAITTFGAVIWTPKQEVEMNWDAHISQQNLLFQDGVKDCFDFLSRCARKEKVDARVYTISDAGKVLYVNAKHNKKDAQQLSILVEQVSDWLPCEWTIHHNGNNLAVLPPYLGKEKAVTYYLRELAPEHNLVLGLGDSMSDLPFMGLCDFALTPTSSQIFEALKLLSKSLLPKEES